MSNRDAFVEARTWKEYYSFHQHSYDHILKRGWALGRISFADQLHHTNIPDVTGCIGRFFSWAVYSQPSRETLHTFLTLFGEFLGAEAIRVRNNRYFFVVSSGPALSKSEASHGLGATAQRLDFCCLSLEQLGSLSSIDLAIAGTFALFGSGDEINTFLHRSSSISLEELTMIKSEMLTIIENSQSIVPTPLRLPLLNSSLVLLGYLSSLDAEKVAGSVGKGAGIAASIALSRASDSDWLSEAKEYCQAVIGHSPPEIYDYSVAPGDVLSRIVRDHYHMSFAHLWPLISIHNPEITDPDKIYPKQVIHLPVLNW